MRRDAALELFAPSCLPMVREGDDLAALIGDALAEYAPRDGDVVVVAQKIVSKAEGRSVELATVTPSERASALGRRDRQGPATGRDRSCPNRRASCAAARTC